MFWTYILSVVGSEKSLQRARKDEASLQLIWRVLKLAVSHDAHKIAHLLVHIVGFWPCNWTGGAAEHLSAQYYRLPSIFKGTFWSTCVCWWWSAWGMSIAWRFANRMLKPESKKALQFRLKWRSRQYEICQPVWLVLGCYTLSQTCQIAVSGSPWLL